MLPLVPLPLDVVAGDGRLTLDAAVVVGDHAATVARVLGLPVGAAAEGTASGSATVVRTALDASAGPAGSTSAERHSVEVAADGVVLRGATEEALFRAATTLAQVVEVGADGIPSVPVVTVHDAPRYGWRGLTVDVARHFFEPDVLVRVVDLMARYKLSVLHLHLTDDQGWRLELPSRPLLTERSGKGEVGDGPGGFYTADEFGRLQEYAAERFVRVVPELDMPGHTNAATHAYGELVPGGEPTDRYAGIEVGFSKLTLDVPGTEPFLRDIFGDVARLTLGEYVHIGGDEVLTMGADEYRRIVHLVHEIVTSHGKKVVGWQEIAQAEPPAGTVLQYWDTRADLDDVRRASAAGSRVLMSPATNVYLDMRYDADDTTGQTWGDSMPPVELRDSYEWDPETSLGGLPAGTVEGVEAALWTEYVDGADQLFFRLLPRLAASAEVAWTAQEQREWDGFRVRVAGESTAWRARGLAFHASPQVDWA
ncbi:family 20 glycosylhydrolase [Luteimicrobium subarcticum]|uniref:beta-N-acetylhexosaminidase n=1 Tax=Luteimicrobium subarcticum TaxID=620910 RepID=A0A2M8WT06_9MICO|nr:family 20 glycosylhydrolase [Luteimicrobium subarcticum]PJI94053.1 hexosaminidase [Luteimicrobium subarcticum]